MDGREGGRRLCDDLTPTGCGTSPGGKRRLIRGGGSAARISNVIRPQDPGGGEVQLTSSRDEAVECPVLRPVGSRSTRQSVGQFGAVRVSAVSVDVTQR